MQVDNVFEHADMFSFVMRQLDFLVRWSYLLPFLSECDSLNEKSHGLI